MTFTLSQAFISQTLPISHSFHSRTSSTVTTKHVSPTKTTRMATPRRSLVATTSKTLQTASSNDSFGDKMLPTSRVRVIIEAPSWNKRIISASNLINAPVNVVWNLLSDYDHLADNIPNLVISEMKPHPRKGGIRVEQCGAQSILGFQFRASLTMDMVEVNPSSTKSRAIDFKLVSSRDFKEFTGTWEMRSVGINKTALYYTVSIVPKGLVPIKAIEWRISEDVPGNMNAVRDECERRRRSQAISNREISQSRSELQ